jgi:hypothetical protein
MLPKNARVTRDCLPGFNRSLVCRLAPTALLAVGGGDYQWFVVRFRGVIIDGGRGLGAEVARFGVEIQRADAVGTARAIELHATLDALDSVGLH